MCLCKSSLSICVIIATMLSRYFEQKAQEIGIFSYFRFHIRLEDGRLLDYLVAHDELMEEKVAFFIREILEALQHLHTCRVAHLDLKVTANFV